MRWSIQLHIDMGMDSAVAREVPEAQCVSCTSFVNSGTDPE